MTSIEPIATETSHRSTLRVLAFSGSVRNASWNSLLLGIVAADLRSYGVAVEEISLRDYPLPLYDGDLEGKDGCPAEAVALRRLIKDHDGLLIACPEYNGSVTPALKNALDWCSRPGDGMGPLEPFRLKPSLIVGTSVGPFGGIRAIGHLRAILSKMGAAVIPEDLAVPNAGAAFSGERLADQSAADLAHRLAGLFGQQLARAAETRL